MDDRFRGHERRFSDVGTCSHPSTDSLIGKLNNIDIRLRQLEGKQLSPPESYFAADLRRAAAINNGGHHHHHHHHCKSLSSTLDDVRAKGTLMDRLHLLETRIHQLSSELDKDGNSIASSSVRNVSVDQMKNKKQGNNHTTDLSTSRVVVDIFNRGGGNAHKVQGLKSKPKDKKEGIDAREKRAIATCHKEKRRMERTKIYKRWFPVGC